MLEKIPLNPLHKNLNDAELSNAVSALLNVYDNHAKHFKKRPGMSLFPIDTVIDERDYTHTVSTLNSAYTSTDLTSAESGDVNLQFITTRYNSTNISGLGSVQDPAAFYIVHDMNIGVMHATKNLGITKSFTTIPGYEYTVKVKFKNLIGITGKRFTIASSTDPADLIETVTWTNDTEQTITFTAVETTYYVFIAPNAVNYAEATPFYWGQLESITIDSYYEFIHPTDKIDGLYYSSFDSSLYVVSDAKLYYIRKVSGEFKAYMVTETNCVYSDILTKGKKPIFQLIDNKLYVANNKHIGIISLGGAPILEDMFDYDNFSPAACVGLTYINKRLVAIDGKKSDRIVWSEVNDYTKWPASYLATAEAEADFALAIGQAWGEVSVFGATTIEGWYDDGSGLIPKVGAVAEVGIGAPQSLVKIEQAWYFLDNFRNVVRYAPSQRIPEVLSFPIAEQLQTLNVVDDARGSFISINGLKFYVITFYKEDVTWVYNITVGSWHQWSYWDRTLSRNVDFVGLSYAYSPDWQMHIWGDRRPGQGNLYIMESDKYTDAGVPMNCVVRSGHVMRDTTYPKICNKLTLRLKRGTGTLADIEPTLSVRWRDNNGAWSNPLSVSLGKIGDEYMTVDLYCLGRYISRMWEFSTSADSDFILIEAFEEFEVVR